MKNGLFKLPLAFLFIASLQLSSCASLLAFTETDDPAEYDRGYATEEEDDSDCVGRYCNQADASGEGRGGRELASLSEPDRERQRAIDARDVVLGMTRRDVTAAWGEPLQREVAGRGATGNERWTYGSRYSLEGSRTVIFENGRVSGWHR